MIFEGNSGEYFDIQQVKSNDYNPLTAQRNETLKIIWFKSDGAELIIDSQSYIFNKNEIIFLTQFHQVSIVSDFEAEILRFNRPFYCVIDHDSEVSCKGVLFYGSSEIPRIKMEKQELEVLETVWKLSVFEFEMQDSLQMEMLQMMLKRILILCTRVYKKCCIGEHVDTQQHDLIREFNYLVEKHFKTKHAVSDYADLLYKSPKTISNSFKKLGSKSPLQFIHDRIMLEARRLLWYTEQDISEIAYDLGYSDIQSFSRFFKKNQLISPREYRNLREGKN